MEVLLLEVVVEVEDVRVLLNLDQLPEELVVVEAADTQELLGLIILEAAAEVVEELLLQLQ